jgi:tetratricopeptide (TPR) repeat protein
VLEYKRAVYVAPKNTEALRKLANAYLLRGDYSLALETAQRALSLGAQQAQLHHIMAQTYLGLKKFYESHRRDAEAKQSFEKALAQFERAVELDPNNPELKREYATQLVEAKQFEKAASFFRQLTAMLPQDAEVWESLAFSLLQVEDYADGVKALQQSLALRAQTNPYPFTSVDQYAELLRLTDGQARQIYLRARSDLTDFIEGKLTPEVFLRRVRNHQDDAERLVEVMERIDPPPRQQKIHLRRSLAYQLIRQSMVALIAFVETNDPAQQERASLLLTEFVNEYEATRKTNLPGSPE